MKVGPEHIPDPACAFRLQLQGRVNAVFLDQANALDRKTFLRTGRFGHRPIQPLRFSSEHVAS